MERSGPQRPKMSNPEERRLLGSPLMRPCPKWGERCRSPLRMVRCRASNREKFDSQIGGRFFHNGEWGVRNEKQALEVFK